MTIIILSGSNNSKYMHMSFYWKNEFLLYMCVCLFLFLFLSCTTGAMNIRRVLIFFWCRLMIHLDISRSVYRTNDKIFDSSLFLFLRLAAPAISNLGCYRANPLLIHWNCVFVCSFVCVHPYSLSRSSFASSSSSSSSVVICRRSNRVVWSSF